jgi:hypothetical protein
MYGNSMEGRPRFSAGCSVIGAIGLTESGKVVIKVGQVFFGSLNPNAWEQTERVELTPAEVKDLVCELSSLVKP